MPSTLLPTSTPTYIRIVCLRPWVVLSIAQLAQPCCLPGTPGACQRLMVQASVPKSLATVKGGVGNCHVSTEGSNSTRGSGEVEDLGSRELFVFFIRDHLSKFSGEFRSFHQVRVPLKKELLSSATSIYRPALKITLKKTTHFCTFLFCNTLEHNFIQTCLGAEAAR